MVLEEKYGILLFSLHKDRSGDYKVFFLISTRFIASLKEFNTWQFWKGQNVLALLWDKSSSCITHTEILVTQNWARPSSLTGRWGLNSSTERAYIADELYVETWQSK